MSKVEVSSNKLTILGYKDEDCGGKAKEIVVQINPETISRKHALSFSPKGKKKGEEDKETAESTNGGYSLPGNPTINMQTLSFTLFLDATGVIDGCDDVVEFIEKFKGVCYSYQGESHGLNYLKINWGNVFVEKHLILKFRLSGLDIEYLMFNNMGTPVRAKLSCSFTQFMSAGGAELNKNNSSPDLTHLITAKAGDTLPLLAQSVYKDPKYYLQVAKVNGLVSIHELNRGQKLIFPPFQQ